ncbi:hypothetical protein ACJ2CR_19235 [Myxococcus faecalis]|uniref:hypothetical protein n=1 Tax=Myxococcus faecalis TaxID=3115646 RepID=UPI0038D1ADB7
MNGAALNAATARGLRRAAIIKEHFSEPPPLKASLIRQSIEALNILFSGEESQPVIVADLPNWTHKHLLHLNGTQADILVIDGHIEIAIIIPARHHTPSDDERRRKIEEWAANDPTHFHLVIDEPPEVRAGTPEAIYKIINSSLEQEEKRFNDIETKARNFFTGNSIVLGAGGLGIANALSNQHTHATIKQLAGGACALAAILGIVASVLFHTTQRTKEWDGRIPPTDLVNNYHCHSTDHAYLEATSVLRDSFESLNAVNNRTARLLGVGIWISLASLLSFFASILAVISSIFFH